MADPKKQAETQLRNIVESSGMSVDDFVKAVQNAGLAKHGQIVSHLKSEHGLTHGNANLMAHTVREAMEGGPPPADDLLDAQYTGPKAALRPVYDELADLAGGLGGDVEMVIQKTGVSFRRAKQFALVQCPSAKRVQLSLNLADTPDDPRVVERSGMCSHKVDLTAVDEVDDDVAAWLRDAYQQAG